MLPSRVTTPPFSLPLSRLRNARLADARGAAQAHGARRRASYLRAAMLCRETAM